MTIALDTIDTKRQALLDATQARIDATHIEIRAAVDVIVTATLTHVAGAATIDFDTDDTSGEVGVSAISDTAGTDTEIPEELWDFLSQIAATIAPDEFQAAAAGVEPLPGSAPAWRLTIDTFIAHRHD